MLYCMALLNRTDLLEGSHSGLVRPPAKRLPRVTGVKGSNPFPSANLILHDRPSLSVKQTIPLTQIGGLYIPIIIFSESIIHE